MKLSFIGTGYVGLVQGAAFAHCGHEVICCDVDEQKIADLKKGRVPIYEPGLEDLVKTGARASRLTFTLSVEEAVRQSRFIFITVPTPQSGDGTCDLGFVYAAVESILPYIDEDKTVILKSTVSVGTTRKVAARIQEAMTGKRPRVGVAFNPEFMAQGRAVEGCLAPDRIVLGVNDDESRRALERFYSVGRGDTPVIMTDYETAELIKYASNAFLATKISYINMFSNICEAYGANISDISYAMGLDKRIGPSFLKAGLGFGGSCFPKDTKACIEIGKKAGVDMSILQGVVDMNTAQIDLALRKVDHILDKAGVVSLWGLAFKPGTNDLREAPSLKLIKGLRKRGHLIKVFDPVIKCIPRIREGTVYYSSDLMDSVNSSDLIILVTEWPHFAEVNFKKIAAAMNGKRLLDLRNYLDREMVERFGVAYYGVGTGAPGGDWKAETPVCY